MKKIRSGNLPHGERGSVLLFSLLTLSAIIITTSGLSAIILSSLKQSRAIDDSIIAYYAAESGIELATYQVRRENTVPTEATALLDNSSAYELEITDGEPVIYAGTIAKDSLMEIPLYDLDQPTNLTDFASVRVTWQDSCGSTSVLESALVGWDPSGEIVWDPNAIYYRHPQGAPAQMSALGGRPYRLRLLARNCDLEDVTVSAVDDSGHQVSLPGRIMLDSVGSFVTSRQRLQALLPRYAPLSGLYDFVVFSECSLVKGGSAACN